MSYCFSFVEFDLRLIGGSSHAEGRVEVYHEGIWGTICDDSWDTNDATVVCGFFNFTGRSEAVGGGMFGEGDGTIWMDNVECYGDESRLDQCKHNGWSLHNCRHKEDAGVKCLMG